MRSGTTQNPYEVKFTLDSNSSQVQNGWEDAFD